MIITITMATVTTTVMAITMVMTVTATMIITAIITGSGSVGCSTVWLIATTTADMNLASGKLSSGALITSCDTSLSGVTTPAAAIPGFS